MLTTQRENPYEGEDAATLEKAEWHLREIESALNAFIQSVVKRADDSPCRAFDELLDEVVGALMDFRGDYLAVPMMDIENAQNEIEQAEMARHERIERENLR